MKINVNTLKEIFLCWDILTSLFITILCGIFLPEQINLEVLNGIYSNSITVLSILFSIFFAALALIITSNEDEYILFLEEEEIYSGIIHTFKITLILVFISLLLSILLYVQTLFLIKGKYVFQYKAFFVIFIFPMLYSLFAIINSVLDAIKYSEKRINYIRIKQENIKS